MQVRMLGSTDIKVWSVASSWDQIFKNAPIGLKLGINDPNNILHRLNFRGYPRSKVKLVLIWLKFNRNDPSNILN